MKPEKKFEFPMRLVRFMALAGVASRRKSEELIADGEVEVNGQIITEQGFKVSDSDKICFAGRELKIKKRTTVVLNKPSGYLCSASDPHAEKTVFDLVQIPNTRLFSVGRLDLNSEGLLILTDDGDLAAKLTHPRFQIKKKYLVKTEKNLSRNDLQKLEKGIKDDGEMLRAEKIVFKKRNEYIFILTEGKKREIRRMVSAVKNRVLLLRRIAVGGLDLGNLPIGKWRYLKPDEIKLALEK